MIRLSFQWLSEKANGKSGFNEELDVYEDLHEYVFSEAMETRGWEIEEE